MTIEKRAHRTNFLSTRHQPVLNSLNRYQFLTICFNLWLALSLVHWTWRGASRFGLRPQLSPRVSNMLKSYDRFRWLSVLLLALFLAASAFTLATQSDLYQAVALVALVVANLSFGYTNFLLRRVNAIRSAPDT